MTYKILLVLSFTLNIFYAQSVENYYKPKDSIALKDYLRTIKEKEFARIDGSHKKEIEEILDSKSERYNNFLADSLYSFNPELDNYIYAILDNIYRANPKIEHKDYKFFIKNDLLPNAACYGDGVFELNLGLISRLKTEDQLAFVICHEIAHKLLDHPFKSIIERVEKFNSEKFKEDIDKIHSERYGKARAAMSLMDEINKELLSYSRETEAEADSLGLQLFIKTNYNKGDAVLALRGLKTDENLFFNQQIRIDSLFNTKEYPFKPFWLKQEISLFEKSAERDDFSLESDSISTHPEIEYRINKILDLLNEKEEIQFKKSDNWILSSLANKSILKFLLDIKAMDLALYESNRLFNIESLSKADFNIYVAQILKNLYESKVKRELGKYVPRPNSLSNEINLNQIRVFMNNIEAKEVRNLAIAYINLHIKSLENDREIITLQEYFNH